MSRALPNARRAHLRVSIVLRLRLLEGLPKPTLRRRCALALRLLGPQGFDYRWRLRAFAASSRSKPLSLDAESARPGSACACVLFVFSRIFIDLLVRTCE